jgi:hypothetical protein
MKYLKEEKIEKLIESQIGPKINLLLAINKILRII